MYCADALTDFFVNGRALRLGGYTFMNGRAPDFTAHAPFQDFMNGRMGGFSSQGQCQSGLHEEGGHNCFKSCFLYIALCLLKVLTYHGIEVFFSFNEI